MCGCHGADRSIWALSTVLALPISPLHCRLYSCCVSYRDNTHTLTHEYHFRRGGSLGLRTGSRLQRADACMVYVLEHNTLKSKQYFIIYFRRRNTRQGETERGVCVFMWEESYAFPCQFKESLSKLWIKCHCAASCTHTHTHTHTHTA